MATFGNFLATYQWFCMATLLAALIALYVQLGGSATTTVPLVVTPTVRADYEPLTPFTYGTMQLQASLATTSEARARGLSYTTELPEDIAKVFVFETSEPWSFWMKEMNYNIDMVWVSETGRVVHIEENVSPATYSATFSPGEPARVVLETVPGISQKAGITAGDTIDISAFLPVTPDR